MGLAFGNDLDDITADDEELQRLLDGSRAAAADDVDDLAQDPDPGWEEPTLGQRLAGSAKKTAQSPPKRVTAAVRKDVKAKVALLVGGGAMMWQKRDSHCGGAMVSAVPQVSDALTDILCDSPDIVKWFTAGGGYMKWLNLMVALQPVMDVAFQHHITHALDDDGPADWSGYAAA